MGHNELGLIPHISQKAGRFEPEKGTAWRILKDHHELGTISHIFLNPVSRNQIFQLSNLYEWRRRPKKDALGKKKNTVVDLKGPQWVWTNFPWRLDVPQKNDQIEFTKDVKCSTHGRKLSWLVYSLILRVKYSAILGLTAVRRLAPGVRLPFSQIKCRSKWSFPGATLGPNVNQA